MLKLPPTDPLNWYRHALIHTIDCPHGNWWFLPWHRGYIGWLETICRKLSGNPDFALPYWDWTESPKLPDAFLVGNLNPANYSIPNFAAFKGDFRPAIHAFWSTLTAPQQQQLALRMYSTEDSLWASIQNDPPGSTGPSMFSDISFVRWLNPPRSQSFDLPTSKAVQISTILDALAPQTFEAFGSGKVAQHSLRDGKGVLESFPHDQVHGEVGGGLSGPPALQGFMDDFLSPVDPIFFMHHANLDRLWDVWTRKQILTGQELQQTSNYPIEPTASADLAAWKNEPFLFFIGPDGKAVAQQVAGDYVSTDFFDYDYQPGSGEIVVPPPGQPRRTLAPRTFETLVGKSFAAAMSPQVTPLLNQQSALVTLPSQSPQAVRQKNGLRVVATITVEPPADSRNIRLHVLVNAPADARNVTYSDPSYAGTYEPFGGHHGGAGMQNQPITFSIGLTDAISGLTEAKRFTPDPMKLTVVAEWPGVTLKTAAIRVTKVEVNTY
jgi:tyrosinase